MAFVGQEFPPYRKEDPVQRRWSCAATYEPAQRDGKERFIYYMAEGVT